MGKKIFDATNLDQDLVPKELKDLTNICSYTFSLVWTKDGSAASINSLVYSPYNKFDWHQLLTNVITDNDGEITTPLMLAAPGDKLDIIFSIYPVHNIASAALYVTNMSSATSMKIAPAAGYQSLTKEIPWAEPKTITLP